MILLWTTLIRAERPAYYERSDAFIVEATDKRFKILAPAQYSEKIGVIVENKTLVKLIGKIENASGEKRQHLSIMPGRYKSKEIHLAKGERFFFVPLSPPFQRVELKVGQKAYEIPEKTDY